MPDRPHLALVPPASGASGSSPAAPRTVPAFSAEPVRRKVRGAGATVAAAGRIAQAGLLLSDAAASLRGSGDAGVARAVGEWLRGHAEEVRSEEVFGGGEAYRKIDDLRLAAGEAAAEFERACAEANARAVAAAVSDRIDKIFALGQDGSCGARPVPVSPPPKSQVAPHAFSSSIPASAPSPAPPVVVGDSSRGLSIGWIAGIGAGAALALGLLLGLVFGRKK